MTFSAGLIGYVAIGGAVGAVARYVSNGLIARVVGANFPYATLSINVIGSIAMGVFVGWLTKDLSAGKPELHALIAIGFLGGFTTFSAFAMDVILLMERGQQWAALAYIMLSVTLSVIGLALGLAAMRSLAG